MSKLIIGIDVGYRDSSTYGCVMHLNDYSKHSTSLIYDHTRLPRQHRLANGKQMLAVAIFNFFKVVLNNPEYELMDIVVVVERTFISTNVNVCIKLSNINGLIEGLCYINNMTFKEINISNCHFKRFNVCDAEKKESARTLARRHNVVHESQDYIDAYIIAFIFQDRFLRSPSK